MTILDNMNEFIVRFEGPTESKYHTVLHSASLSCVKSLIHLL